MAGGAIGGEGACTQQCLKVAASRPGEGGNATRVQRLQRRAPAQLSLPSWTPHQQQHPASCPRFAVKRTGVVNCEIRFVELRQLRLAGPARQGKEHSYQQKFAQVSPVQGLVVVCMGRQAGELQRQLRLAGPARRGKSGASV